LVSNYGTAWQYQKFEFAAFPGPIVMTTSCIIEPRRVYQDRTYSTNEVAFDGVKHSGQDRDFSDVIEQAKKAKGFPGTIEPAQFMTIGFNHRFKVPLADKVIDVATLANGLPRVLDMG
jgi:hydroxylamine reductase